MLQTSPLDQIRIASPCSASWEGMEGSERVRFCQQCQLHVYNLSAMTTAEARALVAKTEGRLCARLYRRADGSVVTQDCPVGLASVRRHAARVYAAAMAVAVFLFANVAGAVVGYRVFKSLPAGKSLTARRLYNPQFENGLLPLLGQPPAAPVFTMGDVCMPPPAVLPASAPGGP